MYARLIVVLMVMAFAACPRDNREPESVQVILPMAEDWIEDHSGEWVAMSLRGGRLVVEYGPQWDDHECMVYSNWSLAEPWIVLCHEDAEVDALDVPDWQLVEQPSGQYPAGRWEALVEHRDGSETWLLAPAEILP